jgi:LPXTG-motif cell wall-anchored protein
MKMVGRCALLICLVLLATASASAAAACAAQPANSDGTTITRPTPGQVVASPFTIEGQYYGSFEGVVPIRLLDAGGSAFINAQTMNECCVLAPYASTVTFSVAGTKEACIVVYRESGADGSLTPLAQIPVTLSSVASLPDTGRTPNTALLAGAALLLVSAGALLRRARPVRS